MFDELDDWNNAAPLVKPSSTAWPPKLFVTTAGLLGSLILVGVLLPVLSGPRCVNQGKLRCMSNLRQMGLGIEGYVNDSGYYPPGTIPNHDLPIERRLGWGFTILPWIDMSFYLKDRGVSDEDAAGHAWDDPLFAGLVEDSQGVAYCSDWPNRKAFLAIAGLGVDAPSLPTGHRRAGIFGDDRHTRPADVKDGTAHTMMLAESDSSPGPWFAGGRATVCGLDPSRQPYIGPGRQFGGNHKSDTRAWFPTEGVNVLFADGSARFIKDSIDPKVFEALSTMAGGEAVAAGIDD